MNMKRSNVKNNVQSSSFSSSTSPNKANSNATGESKPKPGIHNHWFMLIRRIYLTYNVILASLLVLLLGISFGIQLFYMFRVVELQERRNKNIPSDYYSQARVVCYQLSILGILGITCFAFSNLLSKSVQFIRVIWSEEQYSTISAKFISFLTSFSGRCTIPRFVDLSIQLIFIICLELVPLVSGIVFICVRKSISIGVQAFLSFGSFATLLAILLWWIGSVFENYKRLVMFMTNRRAYFQRFISSQQNLEEHIEEDNEKTEEITTDQNLNANIADEITNEEINEYKKEDEEPDNNNLLNGKNPISIKQEERKAEVLKSDPSVAEVMNRARSDSFVSIFNINTEDEESDFQNIDSAFNLRQAENFVDVSKERNIWLLIAWYCCIMPIGFPNLYQRLRNLNDKSKIYFMVRDLWVIIGLLLLIGVISTLGIMQQWKIYALAAVFLGCLIFDMFLNKFVYIPAHNPSKERLADAWNSNIIQRYISLIEEVFYHSPEVIFKSSKLLMYLTIILIAICGIFKLTDYNWIFSIPCVLCAYICLLYILRFNWYRYMKWIKLQLPGCLVSRLNNYREKLPSTPIQKYVPTKLSESTKLLAKNKREKYLLGTNQRINYLHTRGEHPLFRVLSVFTFTGMILVLIIVLLVMAGISIHWSASLVTFGMLSSLCFILFKRFEQDAAESLLGFFLFYVTLLGCVFIVGGINDSANVIRNYAMTGIYPNITNHVDYEICDLRWFDYSIIDYGFFANLAYSPEPYWSHDFKVWFPNCKNCRVVARYNETVYFYDLYIPNKNLSIIGVRGTTTPQDMIQDLDIWKEALLLQGISLVGPFVTFWPEELTVKIIYAIYKIELLSTNPSIQQERFYYQVLDEYVNDIKKQRNVVLVGHSLGGGLAKIVGTRHDLPSISFSAPGVVWSRDKLGLSLANINRVDVNVKPTADLVARVDKEGGLIQNIDCNKTFIECHSLIRTQQELIRSCTSLDNGLNRWIE
jgi:hypothetical protein